MSAPARETAGRMSGARVQQQQNAGKVNGSVGVAVHNEGSAACRVGLKMKIQAPPVIFLTQLCFLLRFLLSKKQYFYFLF